MATFQSNRRNYWLGMILTIGAAIFWGSTYPAIKLTLEYYNVFEISFLRAVFATFTLLVYLGVVGKRAFIIPRDPRILILLLVASSLGATGFWTLLNLSVFFLEPDTSSFLVALYPLMAIVLASIFLKDRMSIPRAIGVVLGIAGTYVIVAFGQGAGIKGAQPLVGVVISLIAALSWAGYMITTKVLIGKTDRKSRISLSPEYVTFTTFIIAIIPTLVIALATSHPSNILGTQISGLGLVIYLGVLASGVAFVMFNIGIKRIGVSTAAINQLLFPVVAIIVSYLILGELINGADIFGIALITFGIIIGQFVGHSQPIASMKQIDS